ncbi:MAG: putative portal protein [Prokaryotic dsDNA virus sp.]|nr:MAG: putative portal protein [Prokaryotic dsDNA virus sp.]|tara:strand:+ start:4388 stop:6661 length:2274 start_codon:yes stop_codon:yes gene_type:complete
MASFFDRFKGLFKNQTTNIDFNKAIYNFLGDTFIASTENDDSYIDKGYRFNATIYSIVNLIVKCAANIPFSVYEIQNENELKRYKTLTSGDFNSSVFHKSQILHKKALVELEGTELHKLLERPNPAQSYNTFIQELLAFGLLTGNRYIYGITPQSGQNATKFKELYVLPSQVMQIHSGGLFKPVDYYTLEYNGQHQLPVENVLHIADFNPYYDGTGSHLYGMSPLKAGLRVLDANNEAVTTGLKYLQNQMARGVLMSEEGDLNEVQARQLKERFKKQYQGSKNAGDVVITPKKLSWINFGLSASDLNLIEQYNATIKDLCNIYSVPVQLLNNTDHQSYNNQKEAKKSLYVNSIIPQLIKIREELNRWLTPAYGNNLYIDFDFTVIPELQEEMDKVVTQMSSSWWLTPNEKRTAMSYGVDEEQTAMDDYYIPANLLPLANDMGVEDPKQLHDDFSIALRKRLVPGFSDVFTTIREAEERAVQLGGSGYHEHSFDGTRVFMPFKTHEEYEAAKEGRLDEYYERVENSIYDDEDEDSRKPDIEYKEPNISDRVRSALKDKVDEHNDKHGDDPDKRVTLRMLIAVFRRGIGAYNTNPQSVRPNVSSADQWAYARTNNFLRAIRTGRFRSGRHDTDLIPAGHPLSSKKSHKVYNDYPQGATNNAKRVLEWDEKYKLRGKMGTPKGWSRAKQLASRDTLSQADVNSIYSFLKRHEQNAEIAEEFRGTPYKDKGYVMYNAWGGKALLSYVERYRSANHDEEDSD